MASTQSIFFSFEPCVMPPILMGNNTHMSAIGKGSIDIGDGTFNDVLCVPHLSNNILSIYQITHGETRKTVEFTPDPVITQDLESREIIATGMVDHASRLYTFSNFAPDDGFDPLAVDYTPSVNIDFEENFGYLNLGILTSDPVLEPCIPSPPSSFLG